MLRKLLGKVSDSMNASEEAAISRLATKHQQLLMEGGRVNTKSESGYNACAAFLDGLDQAARALRLEAAARKYRADFTINYRALFPDEARNYRVDVLEASVEQYAVIWVNGDKFEFSAEAMRRAEALQRTWSELGALLERWGSSSDAARAGPQPSRADLRQALADLDFAWALFEHKYIAELIEIEEKARRLIVQAIEHERRLHHMEMQHLGTEALEHEPAYIEEQKCLVGCIARLNSVANSRRKGRDDLSVQVIVDATAALRRCDAAERGGQSTELLSAARILATDVVESFAAIREYLRQVECCLERVDPHLCNNAGLVSRLVDLEESWEVGARYVQHEPLLDAVCDIVAEIRSAQRIVPELIAMCEECDVELFMVLPRIIWLCFLTKPEQHTVLLRSLLPHRFVESTRHGSSSKPLRVVDEEIERFVHEFGDVRELLLRAQPCGANASSQLVSAELAASQLLVKRVVSGAASEELYGRLVPHLRAEVQVAVETFMRDMEKKSIELQRHCPEDWNQCSAILVQCLSGGNPKQDEGPFRV